MKKTFVFWGLAGLILFICGAAAADTVGNPVDLHQLSGKGVYSSQLSDFISINAGLDVEFLNEKVFGHASEGSTEPVLEGKYYMGRVSCTIFDRIQPYVKIGVSDLEMRWNDASDAVTAKGDMAFAWAVGAKLRLLEIENMGLKFFSQGSIRSTKPDLESASGKGELTNKKFEIFEKQIGAGVSREFSVPGFEEVKIIPYIGGLWSDTSAKVRFTEGTRTFNSGAKSQKKNAGLFFGGEFIFTENVSFNIEGRLIDQESVSAGLTALF